MTILLVHPSPTPPLGPGPFLFGSASCGRIGIIPLYRDGCRHIMRAIVALPQTHRQRLVDVMSTEPAPAVTNFIRQIIDADLAQGVNDGRVATRFPPEPNGYLHIGHAKSICLNFGIARDYGGTCNLRFDDTNPEKETVEYIEAIQKDVSWLGFEWDELRFASDYFERLYECAEQL